MKDTLIKNNGKSRRIKAPSDMPTTYDAWRNAAINGLAYMDVSVNTDTTGSDIGCTTIGTPLSKANLLSDTTKAALGLTQTDPTVNDAFAKVNAGIKSSVKSVNGVAPDAGGNVVVDSGGLKMVKLWENASPTSAFAEQTISLALSNYSGTIIEYKYWCEFNYLYGNTGFNEKNINYVMSKSLDYPVGRRYIFTNTNVTFSHGFALKNNNLTEIEDNHYMVPIRIYGVSGVQL